MPKVEMSIELLNMIADTHNGQMHRDPHAFKGNNTVFYFRDAIREALDRVSLPNDLAALQAQLEETRARYDQLFAERARDITEYKRVLKKMEAVSVAHARQELLLAHIEGLARSAGCWAVVEAIVRRGETK